jgi:hypothetical protein
VDCPLLPVFQPLPVEHLQNARESLTVIHFARTERSWAKGPNKSYGDSARRLRTPLILIFPCPTPQLSIN